MNYNIINCMKKILFLVAAMATLVSCGGGNKYYFDEPESRVINDSEAAFDSLSYAFGMQMALPLHTQLADFNYNHDYFVECVKKYLPLDLKSFPNVEKVGEEFSKFESECMRPYIMAKRMRAFKKDSTALPKIYNEKYDSLMFTNWMSIMASNMVVSSSAPVNLHYVIEGIKSIDELIGDKAKSGAVALDSLTTAKIKEASAQIQHYYNVELPKYNIERSEKWFANIAKQRDVKPLAIGNDTIYYRIDAKGGVKTIADTDSVAVDYKVYTYNGRLLHSSDAQVKKLEQRLADIKADKNLTDSARVAKTLQTKELIKNMSNRMVTVNTLPLKFMKECMSLAGEFGSITVWAPAKFAPPSRQMLANEGIVVDMTVKRLAKGIDVADVKKANLGKPKIAPKPADGTAVQPGKPMSIQVKPAKKDEMK